MELSCFRNTFKVYAVSFENANVQPSE